jgi:hypothetical protein
MKQLFSIAYPIFKKTIESSGCSLNLSECAPVSGYMISLKGYETRVQILKFAPACIDQFIRANLPKLFDRNYFVGTWINQDEVYLDLSLNIPDKHAALSLARINGQIAIFDVLNNTEIEL